MVSRWQVCSTMAMANGRKWIKDGLEQAGKSQRDLAKRLKLSEPAVSLILAGKRKLSEAELYAVCKYLNIVPPTLSGLSVPINITDKVSVGGVAMAGVWKEEGKIESPLKHVPLAPDPAFSDFKQTAIYIQNDGSYAYTIPYYEYRTRLTDNDLVHVVRTRKDGLMEETIRRVVRRGRQQVLTDDAGGTVSPDEDQLLVVGFVTGIYTPVSALRQ